MLKLDNKPIFYFDPNNCCFNLKCETCGGRIWIDNEPSLEEGQEIGLYWANWKTEEDIDPEKVSWGFTAQRDEDEYGWYADSPMFEYKNE